MVQRAGARQEGYNRRASQPESALARVVRTESAAHQRRGELRKLAIPLSRRSHSDVGLSEQRDLFAYMLSELEAIIASVDRTAQAWDRRGCWLKSDRFRLEWEWSLRCGRLLAVSLAHKEHEEARLEAVAGSLDGTRVACNAT